MMPWLVAAASLVFYLATLNHWISFNSVPQVGLVSGWQWQPDLTHPLYFLVTLPFRLIPTESVPLALNVFNAVCAAVILGLLARSVAILPYDRTREQRVRESNDQGLLSTPWAWVPPLFAVAICGLQMTFWENATAGTREMLDLLIFAYIIRCLLEHRLNPRNTWLYRSAFLWGLGMTSNFAMVGFLPLFVAALIWIKRFRFLQGRFLVRIMLLGLAGMSLYLLLPLIASRSTHLDVTFWQALKHNLSVQQSMLGGFPKKALLLFSFTSLFPILLFAVRWPSSFGDISRAGSALTTWTFHLAHLALFLACAWTAFDPPTSPRNIGRGIPFLTFYYLCAIIAGYLAGYLLLVFGKKPTSRWKVQPLHRAAAYVVIPVTIAVLIGAPVGLILKNLPEMKRTNGPMVRDFVSLMANDLPSGPTVVLSDDPIRLQMVQSLLSSRADATNYILLDTRFLKLPAYHQINAELHGQRWPEMSITPRAGVVPDGQLVDLMLRLAQSNQVVYLHPSFGYYFEYFQAKPRGLIQELTVYDKDTWLQPVPTDEEIEANNELWGGPAHGLVEEIRQAIATVPLHPSGSPMRRVIASLHLPSAPNATARILGSYLSRALNHWAVQVQRAGKLESAAALFEQALEVNPDNAVAKINLGFNQDLQAGRASSYTKTTALADLFERARSWRELSNSYGPFDEPSYCQELAIELVKGHLHREAAIEFNRVRELTPQDLVAQLWFAKLCGMLGHPDRSLAVVMELKKHPDRYPGIEDKRQELIFLEAAARLSTQDTNAVVELIETELAAAGDDAGMYSLGAQVYLQAGLLTNALDVVQRQQALAPKEPAPYISAGFLMIRMERYDEAIPVLDKALEFQPANGPARFYRAFALLKNGDQEEAREAYIKLQRDFPRAHQVYHGLGEIAWQNNETNLAIHNYRLYLSNAPPGAAETALVRERLAALSDAAE